MTLTETATPTNQAHAANPTTSIPTTLVLLDPTSPDGESALSMLDAGDQHVTLLVLISGPTSRALYEFAEVEQVGLSTAGGRYLDQVVPRVSRASDRLLAIVASGPSAATELAEIAANEPIHRVLLPSSVDRLEPGIAGLLAGCVAAPVLTASSLTQAADDELRLRHRHRKGTMTTGTASVTIDRPPAEVWAAVADITRMGDWSPECNAGRWVGGATGPAVGAKFEGDNAIKMAGRTVKKWTTTSEVTACEPGACFEFVTEGYTTWCYSFEAAGAGTRVTEKFDYASKGFIGFVYEKVLRRSKAMTKGMTRTLEQVKAALEK